MFASQEKRMFWLYLFAGLALDAAIALVIALIDYSFFAFLMVFFVIQAAYLFVWLRNLIWSWLTYKYVRKQIMADSTLELLKQEKMPEPGDFMENAQSYYARIMEDENIDCKTRVNAAAVHQSMETLKGYGMTKEYLQVSLASEEGIRKYKSTFLSNSAR